MKTQTKTSLKQKLHAHMLGLHPHGFDMVLICEDVVRAAERLGDPISPATFYRYLQRTEADMLGLPVSFYQALHAVTGYTPENISFTLADKQP